MEPISKIFERHPKLQKARPFNICGHLILYLLNGLAFREEWP